MSLAREAEVRALHLLEVDPPDVLRRLAVLAAQLTGAGRAEINIISGQLQHTVVSATGAPTTVSADASFCATIVQQPERVHLIPDAAHDTRFAQHEAVRSGRVSSYAAGQLVTSRGVVVGTLCVYDARADLFGQDALEVLDELSRAVVDVLEARGHEDQLRSSLGEVTDGSRELRRSNEHLAAFAGQVSHDVQGPLASVLMALQLMEEEGDEDGFLLRTALSGAQRMRATIAGLMDFAVLGGTLAVEPIDMNAVVADVLVDLGARMGRARVEVADLPALCGDCIQVRAVTQNLVANALKYAGASPVISITGEHRGDRTRIIVADDGPGVPERERESIFALQVRGEGVELTGVDGLGIGLATCRRIIDAHGGAIGVGDAPAGGAAFWFELPDRGAR